MKKAPGIHNVEYLYEAQAFINDRWVWSRPLGMFGFLPRLRAAWMVFIGKADALIWPEGQ